MRERIRNISAEDQLSPRQKLFDSYFGYSLEDAEQLSKMGIPGLSDLHKQRLDYFERNFGDLVEKVEMR